MGRLPSALQAPLCGSLWRLLHPAIAEVRMPPTASFSLSAMPMESTISTQDGFLQTTNAEFIGWYYDLREEIGEQTVVYYCIENNTCKILSGSRCFSPHRGDRCQAWRGSALYKPMPEPRWISMHVLRRRFEPLNRQGRIVLNQAEEWQPPYETLEEQFLMIALSSQPLPMVLTASRGLCGRSTSDLLATMLMPSSSAREAVTPRDIKSYGILDNRRALRPTPYRENVEAITGGDDTIVLASIDGAIQEGKRVPRPLRLQGYL